MQLDYLISREVTHTKKQKDRYVVEFEGGVEVSYPVEEHQEPAGLEGFRLIQVVFGGRNTLMEFQKDNSRMQLHVRPTKYSITTDEETVWPQRGVDVTEEVPPDPSEERAVEAPQSASKLAEEDDPTPDPADRPEPVDDE